MEAQLKGAVLIALVVVPQWRCPILKPLSAKLPPKSETAPHPGWQDGTILEPGSSSSLPTFLANCLLSFVMMSTAVGGPALKGVHCHWQKGEAFRRASVIVLFRL